MWYVQETIQELNVRFATYRASMSGKIKSNPCQWLAEYFSTGLCKNAKYTVQIIEKWQRNDRTSHGAINLAKEFLGVREEQDWCLS